MRYDLFYSPLIHFLLHYSVRCRRSRERVLSQTKEYITAYETVVVKYKLTIGGNSAPAHVYVALVVDFAMC